MKKLLSLITSLIFLAPLCAQEGPHPTRGYGDHIMKRPPHAAAPARFHQLDAKRWEVVDPAPLVAWYGAADVVADRTRALDAMAVREQTGDPRRRAIIELADRPRELADLDRVTEAPPAVAGRLISYGANRIEVAIDAPAPGIVVLNEVMAPGWHVEVDGRPATGFRVELLLRGVVVGAGRHVIVWSYEPGLTWLLVLWCAGAMGLVAAVIAAWRSRRR